MSGFKCFLAADHQSGTSITELVIVLPLLGALIYGAQFLHGVIEQRQVLQIALRNHVQTKQSNPSVDQVTNALVKQTSTMSPVHAPHWQGEAYHHMQMNHQAHDRVTAVWGQQDSFHQISTLLGRVGSTGGQLLDRLQNVSLGGKYLFVPSPLVQTTGKLSTDPDHPHLKPVASLLGRLNGTGQVTVHGSSYHRPEVGFHPNAYELQALFGLLLSNTGGRSHWHELVDQKRVSISFERSALSSKIKGPYQQGCFMNFIANSKCAVEPQNILAMSVRMIGTAKGTVQLLADIFSGGSASSANKAAAKAVDQAVKTVVDAGVKRAQQKLTNETWGRAEAYVRSELMEFEAEMTSVMGAGGWSTVFDESHEKWESADANHRAVFGKK